MYQIFIIAKHVKIFGVDLFFLKMFYLRKEIGKQNNILRKQKQKWWTVKWRSGRLWVCSHVGSSRNLTHVFPFPWIFWFIFYYFLWNCFLAIFFVTPSYLFVVQCVLFLNFLYFHFHMFDKCDTRFSRFLVRSFLFFKNKLSKRSNVRRRQKHLQNEKISGKKFLENIMNEFLKFNKLLIAIKVKKGKNYASCFS